MYFQLRKLVVWPKKAEYGPRIVEFLPGVVNVITGGSRTGKSAIIPIIDYCLASSECFIPIDVIRDHASWYGVVFETRAGQTLVARRAASGGEASKEFYLMKGAIVTVPFAIEDSNESLDGIKHALNASAGVPYSPVDGPESNTRYGARLSFRDVVSFVFQNQDIIANQNILFYKTHAHKHRERLRNWFPFILGAETLDTLRARNRLQEIERRLAQLTRELGHVKNVSQAWVENMRGHLRMAREYGLLNQPIPSEASPDNLLDLARGVLDSVPDHSSTRIDDVQQSNKELADIEREEDDLGVKIGKLSKRLAEIQNLREGILDLRDNVRLRTDRLQISQWLAPLAKSAAACPACGGTEHPNGRAEIHNIALAFKAQEETARRVAEIPTSFAREEDRIKADLSQLSEKRQAIQGRHDVLLAHDKSARADFQRRRNLYMFLGHLKASFEVFDKLADGGAFQLQVGKLELEAEELRKLVDPARVKRLVANAEQKIAQLMRDRLVTLDVDDTYRQVAPELSTEELSIRVRGNDGHWHYLAEVGSASNWVAFHLALMCALQEFFERAEVSPVPSFVLFDQPSQVYFPTVRRRVQTSGTDPEFSSEDEEAVRSMYITLRDSVARTRGAWQCIVVDHADASIYGSLEGVHEVEVWRQGNKLIPAYWYEPVA